MGAVIGDYGFGRQAVWMVEAWQAAVMRGMVQGSSQGSAACKILLCSNVVGVCLLGCSCGGPPLSNQVASLKVIEGGLMTGGVMPPPGLPPPPPMFVAPPGCTCV